jgi:hypothetical protein
MPFDTTRVAALNRALLISRLRDPSTKQSWNFIHPYKCAMSLASEIYPGWTNRTFGLSYWQVTAASRFPTRSLVRIAIPST